METVSPNAFRWAWFAPNALSFLRLVLAVLFPLLVAPWQAVAVLAAGVSDGLDGYLARRFQATSWQGGLLDAVADKGFALSVLVTLLAGGELALWEVALLLARDLAVALVAAYGALRRWWWAFKLMRPRWLGKVTTVALFGFFLGKTAWPEAALLDQALLLLAGGISLAAGIDYLAQFTRGLRNVGERRRES